jgi:hypothetical protein
LPSKVNRREAAGLAYQNAGREISQAFDVLNSNLTLAAGTLGVLITVLGAGELFGVNGAGASETVQTQAGIPEFSNTSLLLVAAAIPLLLRFYVRATLGYQNLIRFNKIQSAAWDYLSGAGAWDVFIAHMTVYIKHWRSPQDASKIWFGSFKYGFAWVLAVATLAFAWGMWTADACGPRYIAGAFFFAGIAWDVLTLQGSPYFARPTKTELESLTARNPAD